MTKIEFIDFIHKSMMQIDETAIYHRNMIARAIEHAFNNIIYDTFRLNESKVDTYAKLYNSVAVAQNATTLRWQSTLPAPIIQLPSINNGVREIFTPTDIEIRFVPISLREYRTLGHLESNKISDNIIHYFVSLKDNIIKYFEDMSAFSTVSMNLIIPFTSYANTDQVHIPSGQDETIIQLVRQFLGSIPPKDLRADNA